MRLIAFFLLCLGMLCSSLADAEDRAPLQNAITGMEETSATKCVSMQKDLDTAKAQGKWRAEMEQAYRALCECTPAQLKALRSSLSPAVLQSLISESEFQSLMLDRVTGKCVAEQVRASYTGPVCTQRYAQVRPNSEKYCRCLSEKLAALPNREVAEIGLAASDYIPRAADARKKGLPSPEPPPAMKRFLDTDRVCSIP